MGEAARAGSGAAGFLSLRDPRRREGFRRASASKPKHSEVRRENRTCHVIKIVLTQKVEEKVLKKYCFYF